MSKCPFFGFMDVLIPLLWFVVVSVVVLVFAGWWGVFWLVAAIAGIVWLQGKLNKRDAHRMGRVGK